MTSLRCSGKSRAVLLIITVLRVSGILSYPEMELPLLYTNLAFVTTIKQIPCSN
jgi:hypothetical protein